MEIVKDIFAVIGAACVAGSTAAVVFLVVVPEIRHRLWLRREARADVRDLDAEFALDTELRDLTG